MKQFVLFAFAMIVSASTAAQQIIDQSGFGLDESDKKAAVAGIAETLKDPQSANFTKLTKARKSGICGYVNAKNSMGGYVGARMFYANPSAGAWFILPTSQTLSGMGIAELDNVQKMIPVMQENCLNEAGNPIM